MVGKKGKNEESVEWVPLPGLVYLWSDERGGILNEDGAGKLCLSIRNIRGCIDIDWLFVILMVGPLIYSLFSTLIVSELLASTSVMKLAIDESMWRSLVGEECITIVFSVFLPPSASSLYLVKPMFAEYT
ncbi:hypothetical protein VNO77_10350 [Canavalia gladiata]|uniref:Uncharacterized protein n=1 Tax=Canavalia gladiata TaxID=3824 RepID=A0AAN9MDZ3_CANGL